MIPSTCDSFSGLGRSLTLPQSLQASQCKLPIGPWMLVTERWDVTSLLPASKLSVSSESPEPAQPRGSPTQIVIRFFFNCGERRKQISEPDKMLKWVSWRQSKANKTQVSSPPCARCIVPGSGARGEGRARLGGCRWRGKWPLTGRGFAGVFCTELWRIPYPFCLLCQLKWKRWVQEQMTASLIKASGRGKQAVGSTVLKKWCFWVTEVTPVWCLEVSNPLGMKIHSFRNFKQKCR